MTLKLIDQLHIKQKTDSS